MWQQNAETRLNEAQSENRRCKAHLIRLQRDLQRMEGMVKSVLQFKSQLDELRQEKSTTALKYEEQEKPGEEKENLVTQHFLERLKLLDQENSLLRQENENQRLQYERCLDEVANQVVQALLGQKNLREECQRLEERVQELEHQNSVLAFMLKQQLKPPEMGFQSEFSQIASTNPDSNESPLEASINESKSFCLTEFLPSTPSSHQRFKSTCSQQNEFSRSFDKEFDRGKTMNFGCLNNPETTVTKGANVVQVGKQKEKEVVQHSKDIGVSSHTITKPMTEKELLSIDNLSPLISPNKLTVPSHRTVQNIVARFTHSMNQIGQVFSKDSQLSFNCKDLPHSSSSISTLVGNSVLEAERNLQLKSVIPPCSNLDHGFHVSGKLKETSSPSKSSENFLCNKPSYSKQETLRKSSALQPVGVSNLSEENNTNTVVRRIHSNNDSDMTNNSHLMIDTIRVHGLLHSDENNKPNVDNDHVCKDEGYSTMSSDIQIEINEDQKFNIHDMKSVSFNETEHLVKTMNLSFPAVQQKMSVKKDGEMASSSDSGLCSFQFRKPPFLDVDGTGSSISRAKCIIENKDSLISCTHEGDVAKETRSICNMSSPKNEKNPQKGTVWERTSRIQEFETINTHLAQKNEKTSTISHCYGEMLVDNRCKTGEESAKLDTQLQAKSNENIEQLSNKSHNELTVIKPFILLNQREKMAKEKTVVSDSCQSLKPQKTHIQNKRSYVRTSIPHTTIRRNVSDSYLYLRKEAHSPGYSNLRFRVRPLERCASVCESPFPINNSRNTPEKGTSVVQCVSTWKKLENSPVCSDSLSSVCSSTSDVTNSEESEDLKPTSLKCSRENDLWSPSEDEHDFPEHYTFVQEWLQQEGEHPQQDCSGVYSVNKEEIEGWRFQKSMDGIEKIVAENYEIVQDELIPWKNRVLGNTKEKRIMEEELKKPLSRLPIRKIPSFRSKSSNISKVPLSKTKPCRSRDFTERSCGKHNHQRKQHTEIYCKKLGKQENTKNGDDNSYWSKEIDWKRVDASILGCGMTETSCPDDRGSGSSEEISKQISDVQKGGVRCDNSTVQVFQTSDIPSEIKVLQNESPTFKSDVYKCYSPQCLKESGKIADNQSEPISANQIDFEDTLSQCDSNLDSNQGNLDQNVYSNTHTTIQTNSLSASMNSKNSNEYFSSKQQTLAMSTHSFFARPKCQNEENQLLQRKEQTNVKKTSLISQKPVIQSIKNNTHKIKPLVPPKPRSVVAGSSKIPIPGNYRNNESNYQKTDTTKIPSFPSSSATVLKKEKEGLDRSKRKLLPNKNAPLTKGKLKSPENYKKTSKISKQVSSTQEENKEKEINQIPTASKRQITKPVDNNTDAQNSEKTSTESALKSPRKKEQVSSNQQNTGVDLEQLSFETGTLSVAQKIQILNALLDENEKISFISCFRISNSTNINDNSPETSPEIDENNKEGYRSSWIHVPPDINFRDQKITSQLFESALFTSISSEESEVDEDESHPEKSFHLQHKNGWKSGEFPSSPIEEESPSKYQESNRSWSNMNGKEGKESDISIETNLIHPKIIHMTDSCLSVLSRNSDSPERISFSDSCAGSFCSSTRSLDHIG
ncbi:uncharacterized protein LOC106466856 [Limulus polyphemus]|uniref:Uncharacterized protein LOC106466856 n=1 Tax=Limulus polyphemus TaxID=6850 RepID=A0ABM1BID8_LIMPO|nr:uncharacterized protein LOC106466856 [Limulus polyphemus]